MEWFEIQDNNILATPSLCIYKDRMEKNIDNFIRMVSDVDRLRPHVKTNKIAEVCTIMMQKGISKFKCATIAELEMLCRIGAKDVLFAYPLVGPNIDFFIQLQLAFPNSVLSFLVDNISQVEILDNFFSEAKITGNVFIDVNVGMNRTGCKTENIYSLFEKLKKAKKTSIVGFHAYDGHIHEGNTTERCKQSYIAIHPLLALHKQLEAQEQKHFQIVIGGSPTFACYLDQKNIQLSPGTFVFWDSGYKMHYPELPFDYAAVLATRVVSILDNDHLCLDLGHKAVASEMTQPRVHFLSLDNANIVSQSEEHLLVKVPNTTIHFIGEMIYAVPVHICPTVALYDKANVVEKNIVTQKWDIVARKRSFNLNP